MSTSEQTQELAGALAKAQGQMSAAKFNRTNPHFKNRYADLSSIIDAVRKPLSDNGLSVTQTIEMNGAGLALVTTLRHASGQWTDSHYPLPGNAKPQEFGSALTYAKRYSLSSMVCISADEDDDAEIAQRSDNAHVNGNGSGKLNQTQIDFLRSAIVEAGADIEKFCNHMKVKRIEDIPPSRLEAANIALTNFCAKNARGGA